MNGMPEGAGLQRQGWQGWPTLLGGRSRGPARTCKHDPGLAAQPVRLQRHDVYDLAKLAEHGVQACLELCDRPRGGRAGAGVGATGCGACLRPSTQKGPCSCCLMQLCRTHSLCSAFRTGSAHRWSGWVGCPWCCVAASTAPRPATTPQHGGRSHEPQPCMHYALPCVPFRPGLRLRDSRRCVPRLILPNTLRAPPTPRYGQSRPPSCTAAPPAGLSSDRKAQLHRC